MNTLCNILFLRTGTSCRPQMAEGRARLLADDGYVIQSAGIEVHGKSPRAIAVMSEAGVDITAQEPTMVTDVMLNRTDLVLTVCGCADERCPLLPPGTLKEHRPLDDPARTRGGETRS